ncbi:MAG: cysteine desulfurase [Hyphomicrobiales bacterium]|nr:cysteine desulfurase [Hyphomicrobiales bacterium]
MTDPVYLDHNATTPVRPEAAAALAAAMAATGNPSSVHGFGRAAREAVEAARDDVAALVGARAGDVVFTGGGTESNALALAGCGRRRVLASAVEHPSVLAAADELIPVDGDGVVDLAALDRLLDGRGADTVVSAMLANNETGVLQPVARVAEVARRHGALVHCDAVQAAGKVAVDMAALGADLLTLSAHKLGGPMGAGALVLAPGTDLAPLLRGGGQERGRRAGTENLPGIAAFATAARVARRELETFAGLARLRDRLERRLRAAAPAARVFGAAAPRLPNTTCVAMPGVPGATQVMALDLAGYAVSAGAACSSGKVAPSHVLAAMGADPADADGAIRVSLGWTTKESDVDGFAATWAALYGRLGHGAGAALKTAPAA